MPMDAGRVDQATPPPAPPSPPLPPPAPPFAAPRSPTPPESAVPGPSRGPRIRTGSAPLPALPTVREPDGEEEVEGFVTNAQGYHRRPLPPPGGTRPRWQHQDAPATPARSFDNPYGNWGTPRSAFPQQRRPLSMATQAASDVDTPQLVPMSPEGIDNPSPPRARSTLRGSSFFGHRAPERRLPPSTPLTVGERLAPTIEVASAKRDKLARKAHWSGIAVNVATGLNILFSALITGLSAAGTGRTSSIATSIMGGITTLIASYLARLRAANEPEVSRQRAKDLDHFIRDAQSFVFDNGWRVSSGMTGEGLPSNEKDEWDVFVDDYRKQFEDLLGATEDRKVAAPSQKH